MTLYLRTRAERISFMFVFHLTLILQTATNLLTRELQHWEEPCVSLRVGWSGTESSITSVSGSDALALRPTHCQPQSSFLSCGKHTHKSSTFSNHTVQPHTYTHTQSSNWVNCGKKHCPGLRHPSAPMEKNVSWIRREYGSRTLKVLGSIIAQATSHVRLNFRPSSLQTIWSVHALTSLTPLNAHDNWHLQFRPKNKGALDVWACYQARNVFKLVKKYSTPFHLRCQCWTISVVLFCFSGNNIPRNLVAPHVFG